MPPTDLATAVADLARTASQHFTIDEMLRQMCWTSVQALGADGAGVMIVDGKKLRFVHANPARIVDVERLQEVLQRGPCRDSLDRMEPLAVGNIAACADRWPEYAALAARLGLQASASVPLQARGRAWGVLDLYRERAMEWTDQELGTARLFADVAASYFAMAADRDMAGVAQRNLAHLATHDELTGLPNRTLLLDLAGHALAVGGRRGTSVAALFIDLDRFKKVNDALGHAAGDEVLAVVASRLRYSVRDSDTVARLSGDEFVVVCEDLPGAPDEAERRVRQLGRRIGTALRQPPIPVAGRRLRVTASIGGAISGDHHSAEALIDEADAAMYAAKKQGPGQVVVGSPRGAVRRKRSLATELREAVAGGQLRLHYQPIVGADPSRPLVAVEALVRWQHPQEGLLPAVNFISAAERSGDIVAIGQWVIDRAAAQMRAWLDRLGPRAPQRVFVNMSPGEITHSQLADTLRNAMDTYRLAPSSMGLEIVEAHFIDAQLAPCLLEHRRRGHPLAVDDFGTGYSSLARLVDLPVEYAKIDQSFVAGLPDDDRRRDLVTAIVVVAHQLGLQVIGEGVETAEQAAALRAAGCDLLQGYYIGYPESGDALAERWDGPVPSGVA